MRHKGHYGEYTGNEIGRASCRERGRKRGTGEAV